MVDDGRTTDGRTTEHGYTISSPCEPDGSGELKRLKAGNFGFRMKRNCTIRVAKTKALISCAVTAQLICALVFA